MRQAEAKGRQAAYDALTTEEKLASLPEGGAHRQRARLEAQLAGEKASRAGRGNSGKSSPRPAKS